MWGKAKVQNYQLSQDEKDYVEEFNRLISSRPFRTIIIGTQQLAGYLSSIHDDPKEFEWVLEVISRDIQEKYMMTDEHKQDLRKAFWKDVLNRDVPFFTEKDQILYYGLESMNIKIGHLK